MAKAWNLVLLLRRIDRSIAQDFGFVGPGRARGGTRCISSSRAGATEPKNKRAAGRYASGAALVVGVACACVCGTAQAEVVKLAELEARALSQRPEVAAGGARVRQATAEISAAESAYWPTVSASIDGSVAPGRALVPFPYRGKDYLVAGSQTLSEPSAFQPQARYGASVAARGTLYDFGRTRSALEAARAKARASEADAGARGQVLVLEVRAAYLRWSVAQALWELSKQAEADAKARADRIAGLIAEGAAPPSAATAASAQANAAATESERAELELETARLELGYLSARDLGPDAQPDPALLGGAPQPSAAGPEAVEPIAFKLQRPAAETPRGGEPNGAPLAAKAAQLIAAAGTPEGPSGSPAPPSAAAVPTPAPQTVAPWAAPAAAATAGAKPASGALQPSAASPDAAANPRLEALEKARAAAKAALHMQSRMSAPALAYRLNAGVEAQELHFFPMFGVGIGLTVPLWDGGATSAAEAGARAAEAELAAQLDAERAHDKHMKERRNLQFTHADKLLALAEKARALAETRLQQLREGPTLGAAEQEALAAAEAERTRTQAEVVRARAAKVELQLGL